MSVIASQLIAKVSTEGVDTSKRELQSMGETVKETSGGFKSMLGNALSFMAGQAIFNLVGNAVGFLRDQVRDSIGLAIEHQDVMEQTAKVLRSTADASGMTQQSLEDLATSLEKTTFFSKDQTEAGENLLLTFTNIGKDVFPLATKTMLDMSKAMGQDVKSTAIMMGKALNDPLTGLTALQRVGVTFSDSEKEQIKTMMAHNDVVGAQNVMLKELQTEFGGSADATTTFGGKMTILKNRLDDVKEQIGTALLPVLGGLIDHLVSPAIDLGEQLFHKVGDAIGYVGDILKTVHVSDFHDAWVSLNAAVRMLFDSFGSLGSKIDPIKGDFDPLAETIQKLAKDGLAFLTARVWDAYVAISAIAVALHDGVKPVNEFTGPLQNIASLLKGQFVDSFKFAGSQAKQISTWFQGSGIVGQMAQEFKNLAHVTLDLAEIFIRVRGVILDIEEHAFAKFAPIIEKILPPLIKLGVAIDTGIAGALQYVKPYIDQALAAFEKFADGVIDRVSPLIDKMMPSIIEGVKDVQIVWVAVWPYLKDILEGTFRTIIGIIQIAWSLISGIILIGLDILSGNWGQAWQDMKDMLGGIWAGIQNVIGGQLQVIQSILSGVGAFVDRFLVQPFRNALGTIGGVFSNIGKLISDATGGNWGAIPGDLHVLGFAGGTDYAPGGPALVGERGPELIYMPRGTRVVPNNQLGVSSTQASGSGQPIILVLDGRVVGRGLLPYQVGAIRNNVGVRF